MPSYRLDNIFRTNLQANYQAGHWEQYERNQDARPYLMYDAINDSRVRPSHLALDGKICRIDDPQLRTHAPPNGYRCRYGLISLTEKQALARSGDGTGLNKSTVLPDGTPAQPDKGWAYSPRDRLQGVEQALAKRQAQYPKGHEGGMLLSALETKLSQYPSMELDALYRRAEQIKPDFDRKIKSIAEAVNGVAITPSLKSKERAEAKINIDLGGDISKIRDIVRASIIVDTSERVNQVYLMLLDNFVLHASRNGYLTPIHSSDGYFDAKLDVNFSGFFAEIQLHTQAMWQAKEAAHDLYEQRQALLRAAVSSVLLPEQKKRIADINKQMREIYRKAAANGRN